ncbi:transcription termination/antitermination protein NusA, partial [Candidatus Gracilibacteria bacterium]|nr:transcription termination/antitermination protein NusA [Candidatus Gracilibacteria bacterium]
NYLNDFDYATHHVSDRVRFRPRGEYMLRSELKLKGLDEKLVDKVLAEAQIDEAALAYDLLMKKSKRWKNDEPRKRKDKAYRFLASRGFALDAIYKAIKRCYDPSVMSGSIYGFWPVLQSLTTKIMQSQFLAAINQLCDEKNISKEDVIDAIKAALRAAYRKDYGTKDQEIEVDFDNNSGVATVYQIFEVMEDVQNADLEIDEADAKKYNKKAELGDMVRVDVTPSNYGRIAAQAAKQVIIQRIQEAEREVMYETFKDRENELVNAIVHRVDGKNVYLNLDNKITMNLPIPHQIPGEKYYSGQRTKIYLDKVIKTTKGPELLISRTHPQLVKKLLELEIPEVKSGLVDVKSIAREPGVRCKVAVKSNDEKIDPIGSCVGQKGVRVQNVMDELNGERIDIIQWSENLEEYIRTALAPAKTSVIVLDEKIKRAKIYVQPDQRPLAIGKQGQNVRLASNLTGWELDIMDIADFDGADPAAAGGGSGGEQKPKVEGVEELGLDKAIVATLTEAGLSQVAQLKGLSVKDLSEIDGIGEKGAKKIEDAVKKVA